MGKMEAGKLKIIGVERVF